MGKLRAGVQYNDWIGTAAVDRHDTRDLSAVLEERGYLDPQNDVLFGAKLWGGAGELYVTALLTDHGSASSPAAIREVATDLSADEFFATFKRVDVILVGKHTDIDKEY